MGAGIAVAMMFVSCRTGKLAVKDTLDTIIMAIVKKIYAAKYAFEAVFTVQQTYPSVSGQLS